MCQLVNVDYVNLDSLETSVNRSASVAIVKMKLYVMRQLVNVTYVNLDLVDISAQVSKSLLKWGILSWTSSEQSGKNEILPIKLLMDYSLHVCHPKYVKLPFEK